MFLDRGWECVPIGPYPIKSWDIPLVHDKKNTDASCNLPTVHLPVLCGLQMMLYLSKWPLAEKVFSPLFEVERPTFTFCVCFNVRN